MKILTRLTVCLSLLAAAKICVADDSTDRQPDALRGINSVAVKVTDKSKIPGMPSEAMVRSQLEDLLQTKCNLQVTSKSPMAELHVDLLMIPIALEQPRVNTDLALVRTSVWRPVVPVAADGIAPDLSKPVLKMTGWLLTTITDPRLDPFLTNTILNHANTLELSLRATGETSVLPRNFSEAFFASRLPEMKAKLETLFNQKLRAIPFATPAITVDLALNNGVLTYKFRGTIQYVPILTDLPVGVPFTVDIDKVNPEGRLDLAALSAIGALSTAKICLNGAPQIPGSTQCVTISDLFQ